MTLYIDNGDGTQTIIGRASGSGGGYTLQPIGTRSRSGQDVVTKQGAIPVNETVLEYRTSGQEAAAQQAASAPRAQAVGDAINAAAASLGAANSFAYGKAQEQALATQGINPVASSPGGTLYSQNAGFFYTQAPKVEQAQVVEQRENIGLQIPFTNFKIGSVPGGLILPKKATVTQAGEALRSELEPLMSGVFKTGLAPNAGKSAEEFLGLPSKAINSGARSVLTLISFGGRKSEQVFDASAAGYRTLEPVVSKIPSFIPEVKYSVEPFAFIPGALSNVSKQVAENPGSTIISARFYGILGKLGGAGTGKAFNALGAAGFPKTAAASSIIGKIGFGALGVASELKFDKGIIPSGLKTGEEFGDIPLSSAALIGGFAGEFGKTFQPEFKVTSTKFTTPQLSKTLTGGFDRGASKIGSLTSTPSELATNQAKIFGNLDVYFGKKAFGYYTPKTGLIEINQDLPRSIVKDVVPHEEGHAIDFVQAGGKTFEGASISNKKDILSEFVNLHKQELVMPNKHGGYTPYEIFAESYRLFKQNPAVLEKNAPIIFKGVQDVANKKLSVDVFSNPKVPKGFIQTSAQEGTVFGTQFGKEVSFPASRKTILIAREVGGKINDLGVRVGTEGLQKFGTARETTIFNLPKKPIINTEEYSGYVSKNENLFGIQSLKNPSNKVAGVFLEPKVTGVQKTKGVFQGKDFFNENSKSFPLAPEKKGGAIIEDVLKYTGRRESFFNRNLLVKKSSTGKLVPDIEQYQADVFRVKTKSSLKIDSPMASLETVQGKAKSTQAYGIRTLTTSGAKGFVAGENTPSPKEVFARSEELFAEINPAKSSEFSKKSAVAIAQPRVDNFKNGRFAAMGRKKETALVVLQHGGGQLVERGGVRFSDLELNPERGGRQSGESVVRSRLADSSKFVALPESSFSGVEFGKPRSSLVLPSGFKQNFNIASARGSAGLKSFQSPKILGQQTPGTKTFQFPDIKIGLLQTPATKIELVTVPQQKTFPFQIPKLNSALEKITPNSGSLAFSFGVKNGNPFGFKGLGPQLGGTPNFGFKGPKVGGKKSELYNASFTSRALGISSRKNQSSGGYTGLEIMPLQKGSYKKVRRI